MKNIQTGGGKPTADEQIAPARTCKYAKSCKFGQFVKKRQTSSAQKHCKKCGKQGIAHEKPKPQKADNQAHE